MESDVMSVEEVAKYFKVSQKLVRDLINRKELPAAKIGRRWRIQRKDVDKFIRERTT